MNITVTKVKKILEKDYGWSNLNAMELNWIVDELIRDTLKVVDDKLKSKNIYIKK
jgi:hypothetical protein